LKKDIENRTDIELLVNTFYTKVIADKKLGYIFNDVAHVNWSTHFLVMYNFWENAILFSGSYEGNPIKLHKQLHPIQPLNKTHFNRWNNLFVKTVNELFKGSKADLAKERALNISVIISENIQEYQKELKFKSK
jgi:hemoglobin